MLHADNNRQLLNQVKDNSSSLAGLRARSSFRSSRTVSSCTESSALLSIVFDFDEEILDTSIYQRQLRIDYRRNLRPSRTSRPALKSRPLQDPQWSNLSTSGPSKEIRASLDHDRPSQLGVWEEANELESNSGSSLNKSLPLPGQKRLRSPQGFKERPSVSAASEMSSSQSHERISELADFLASVKPLHSSQDEGRRPGFFRKLFSPAARENPRARETDGDQLEDDVKVSIEGEHHGDEFSHISDYVLDDSPLGIVNNRRVILPALRQVRELERSGSPPPPLASARIATVPSLEWPYRDFSPPIEAPVTCDIPGCGILYSGDSKWCESSLRRHKKNAPQKRILYYCGYCKQSFTRTHNRREHVRKFHADVWTEGQSLVCEETREEEEGRRRDGK